MDIFNIDTTQFLSFLLTLMRISVVVFMLPIFDTSWLPGQIKASLALIMALALWPALSIPGVAMPAHPFAIVLLLASEVVLGLVLGFSVRCFFAGIQSGGEILAMQMGFSMITLSDPLSGNNTGLIAHFLYMVATLVFLSLNGHLVMLQAFAYSFKVMPAGGMVLGEGIMRQLIEMVGMIFVFAIRVAAPVMVVLMMCEVGLGLMNRAAQQIPVMEIGFPLKISIGFFFIGFLFVIMAEETATFITGLGGLFLNLMSLMR